MEYELKKRPSGGPRTRNLGGAAWAIYSEGPPPLVLFYDVDEVSGTVLLKRIEAGTDLSVE